MFTRLAQFALIVLAVIIGNPAKAAPLAYGTYYDETKGANCVGPATCRVNFAQLPSDKLLMVRRVNCTVQSSLPLQQAFLPLQHAFLQVSTTLGGSALARNLPVALPPPLPNTVTTSWETNTQYLVGQGRFPFVEVTANNTTGTIIMNCTIIGDLVTPIQ